MAGITFYGSASQPADNSSYESTATPARVTPPASMVAGQLCVLIGAMGVASTTRGLNHVSDDGQTWNALHANNSSSGYNDNQTWWCVFNGTWSANPGVSNNGNATNGGLSAVLLVYSPSGPSPTWSVDQAEVDTQEASATNITISGQTPTNPSTVTLAWWSVGTNRTWTLQTAGWSQPQAQWRNTATTSGVRVTLSTAHLIQTSAVATGSVTNQLSSSATSWGNIITFTDGLNPNPAGTSQGFIQRPGNPALRNPSNPLQFQGVISASPQLPTLVMISGLSVSGSGAAFGSLSSSVVRSIGFVKSSGPGTSEPFSINQFQAIDGDTSNPSPTNLDLRGLSVSTSVSYGAFASASAQLSGLAVSHSTVYGTGQALTAGSIFGMSLSASVGYSAVGGAAGLLGAGASSSTAFIFSLSGSFQPLIPLTAVTDIRLHTAYQPWTLRKGGTIG